MIKPEIYAYWKHLTLQSMLSIINKLEWDRVIFCYDARNYWRYKIYPQYKQNRAKNRANSPIDFETFMIEINQFSQDLKTHFNTVYHLEIDEAEADDVAAVITEKLSNNNEYVMVVTADKDYKQLIKFPNVDIFDPNKKKNMTSINIDAELEAKFIQGDKGDNIFAVKPKVGPVKAANMVESGEMHKLHLEYTENPGNLNEEQKDMVKNYIRNRQLISFEYIPIEIKNSILNQFNNYKLCRFNQGALLTWLSESDLRELSTKFLSNQSTIFMKLYKKFQEREQELDLM